jgi:ABC-type polysaccharide/polyol phosphate export permease
MKLFATYFVFLLRRDVKARYAGSALGLLWALFYPLMMIGIFWFVFSFILRVRPGSEEVSVPYLSFLLSAFLPWLILQEGVVRGAGSILESGHLVKNVSMPLEIIPVVAATTPLIYQGAGLLLFLIAHGALVGLKTFMLPILFLLLLIQLALAYGLVWLLAALCTYLRDLLQVLPALFQALFFLTPIIYPVSSVPEGFRGLFSLNPLTLLAEAYHDVVLYGRVPAPEGLALLLGTSLAVFFLGLMVFNRVKDGFVDVL